ncbi:MAG: hypothetical protein JSV80_06825 [Acidobacteriota bacterium]|nr:MAG: hypothetical protein JSV80_06825 [Acidobacteriota bacterium]
MRLVIEPYEQRHVPAVRAFNQRVLAGGDPAQFPESPVPRWLPPREGIPVYQQMFVALEGEEVRGAYMLKPQAFAINGRTETLAHLQLPISEGVADERFALVGLLLLKDAQRRHPLLFGLGGGGYREAIIKLLGILKWKRIACPFLFRVVRPARFLHGIVYLRKSPARRLLLDALAFSGLGWAGLKTVQALKRQPARRPARRVPLARFGHEADEIFQRATDQYAVVAVRDALILNTLYPPESERFLKLLVERDGKPLGWAVLLDTPMHGHKQFGHLRVGTVVDCLAVPGEEQTLVETLTGLLERRGVDLIVTNQLHRDWCAAFRNCGYLEGPSNFVFAASRPLDERIAPFQQNVHRIHMTRGDGDGPIHL